jgi:hypothetical protein
MRDKRYPGIGTQELSLTDDLAMPGRRDLKLGGDRLAFRWAPGPCLRFVAVVAKLSGIAGLRQCGRESQGCSIVKTQPL